ncbi:MAG: asparagine synthase-related protein, partial [Nitrosopumilus sp.]
MEDYSSKIYQILEKSCDSSKSQLIALSGGLDSSILANFIKKRKTYGIAIISKDFVSTDLTYCQIISKETNIPLTIYNATTSEILDAVESIIGKNILVCSTTLFIKNPKQEGFVSYHQDAKY